MTSFDLKRPCDGCPFSRGPKAVLHLRPGRLREIVDSDGGFACHQTVPEIGASRRAKQQECAGYLIYHLVNGTAPQMMRIAGRLGMIDEEALMKNEAEVVTDLDELINRHRNGHP